WRRKPIRWPRRSFADRRSHQGCHGSAGSQCARRWSRRAMNVVSLSLACVASLLVVALLGVAFRRASFASSLVYACSLIVCTVIFVIAGSQLLARVPESASLNLPLGLPWIGAHFRIDSLSAFFLVVINLGA